MIDRLLSALVAAVADVVDAITAPRVPDDVFEEIVLLQPRVIAGLRAGNAAIAERPDGRWRELFELAALVAMDSRDVAADPLGALAALRQAARILTRAEEELLAA